MSKQTQAEVFISFDNLMDKQMECHTEAAAAHIGLVAAYQRYKNAVHADNEARLATRETMVARAEERLSETIDELAKEQGVAPVSDITALRGESPLDDEEYISSGLVQPDDAFAQDIIDRGDDVTFFTCDHVVRLINEVRRLRSAMRLQDGLVDVTFFTPEGQSVNLHELKEENMQLRARVEELERSEGNIIDERDSAYDTIDKIADALGDKTEWTNLNDRGNRAIEAAKELRARVKELEVRG